MHLRHHIASVHEGVRYSCDQCSYKAKSTRLVNQHHALKHLGIKYPCNECDYKGTTNGSLQQHKKTVHEGLRYSCDQCDYQGTTSSHLNVHKKTVHEGRRYYCDKCDYKGTTSSHLYGHLRNKHKWFRYINSLGIFLKKMYCKMLDISLKINVDMKKYMLVWASIIIKECITLPFRYPVIKEGNITYSSLPLYNLAPPPL